MTIPSLRVEQHAQILSFAIIGYGIAGLIELIDPIFQVKKMSSLVGGKTIQTIDIESYLWPKILFAIVIFIICFIASLLVRQRDSSPRGWALTLAVLVFGFFPLGTLLSVYILIYLFVIDDGNYSTEPTVNAVHLNE